MHAELVKQLCYQEGFDLVGITDTEVPEYAKEAFLKWLSLNLHAGMDYMERRKEERLNLRKLWKDARSVVVVAKSYYYPVKYGAYRIARYALGKDYHKVMKKKLVRIGKRLKEEYSIDFRAYVDTGPILEKVFAQKAGLGWQGKNTLLINPRMGSYLFLGILLLNVELEKDEPFVYDFCGRCTRCIDACPTQAIRKDRLVDANRCISYWTIENRSLHIPDTIASKMDGWLFGCDICQEVCPWNTKAKPTDWKEFLPREDLLRWNILDILNMTRKDWEVFARSSAIKRAKLEGIKRNAKYILRGNPLSS